jgi:hypothetical protein
MADATFENITFVPLQRGLHLGCRCQVRLASWYELDENDAVIFSFT